MPSMQGLSTDTLVSKELGVSSRKLLTGKAGPLMFKPVFRDVTFAVHIILDLAASRGKCKCSKP